MIACSVGHAAASLVAFGLFVFDCRLLVDCSERSESLCLMKFGCWCFDFCSNSDWGHQLVARLESLPFCVGLAETAVGLTIEAFVWPAFAGADYLTCFKAFEPLHFVIAVG